MHTPHLVPENLISEKHGNLFPPAWAAASSAIVCFTPLPGQFEKYSVETASLRHFLHSPNSEVRLCQYDNFPFIVISEVYGFAVGATTVEELVHHGIKHIIGLGYVGAYNGAPVGKRFVATGTMSDLPLAVHYGIVEEELCEPTASFLELITSCADSDDEDWGRYTVWSGNSLYREYPKIVSRMKSAGCEVVNMDTLSIYAVTPVCAEDTGQDVECIYVGTVTDSINNESGEWDSDLMENVSGSAGKAHDGLVKFLVETVIPRL